jgi:hypothetical protein
MTGYIEPGEMSAINGTRNGKFALHQVMQVAPVPGKLSHDFRVQFA